MSFISLLLRALAALFTGGLGVCAILGGAEILSLAAAKRFLESATGVAVFFLFGALLILVGLYFILLITRSRSVAARFSQEGEWGKIELSSSALREFVSGILREEIGIDRFRVRLQHMEGGISILVRTALSLQEKVSEVGRQIQETLARRVVERTGVEVREVSVLVGSIRSRPRKEAKEEAIDADAER